MKKVVTFILLALFSTYAFSETIYGITTNCMIYQSDTEEWIPIDGGDGIDVEVSADYLYIDSNEPQKFYLYSASDVHTNSFGHEQITMKGLDQDDVTCKLRFVYREDIEAPLQIYIHYNNIDYVYNVIFMDSISETPEEEITEY